MFRNRRATASALVGLALGVAVVAAPWVALDSTLRGVMDYYLEGIFADIEAQGSERGLMNASGALAAVPNVERTEPARVVYLSINETQTGLPQTPYGPRPAAAYLVSPTFDSVTGRLGISWDGAPSPGGAIVHDSLRAEGLDLGERLVLEVFQPLYDANGTYVGGEMHNSSYTVGGFYQTPNPARPFPAIAVFLAAAEVARFRADLNLTYEPPVTILGWLDRGALMDPYDAQGTTERLQRQLIRMQNAVAPHGFVLYFTYSSRGPPLSDIPVMLDAGTFGLRLLFFLFAIPTLGLAALLAKVGFDVGLSARRRELAVLRARGFSVRGVRIFLTGEALVAGALAGAVGLVLAIGLSRVFAIRNPAVPVAVPMDVALTSGTVLLAFLLGWLLALGASRRGIQLSASGDIVAGLKAFHPEEVAVSHRASRDFLLAGVAAAGFLLMLATASMEGSPLSALTFFLGLSTAMLAPVAPFLLTAAVARYLTRGTTKAYQGLSRLLRPAVGELQPLVEKNIVRAPRRASNTAIMATFAVGFVLLISIIAASSQAYRLESVRRQVPSDVVAEAFYGPIPDLFAPQTVESIRVVPGVAEVTVVVAAFSNYGNAVLFEASTYLRTVPWVTSSHLGGAEPRQLMAALDAGGAFAANQEFQDSYGLLVGDDLFLQDLLTANVTARLAAVVTDLPGLLPCCQGGVPPTTFLDLSSVPGADLSSAWQGRFLIDVEPGADPAEVARAVSDLFDGRLPVTTQAEAIRREAENPFVVATFSYLTTQTHVAIALSVVGVGLLVYTGAALRRDELATLVARGAGPRTVAKLVMAEGWVVSILGLLLGVLGGLVTAATFLALAALIARTPIPFVVPLEVVLPLLAAVIGVWIASFLGALSIQRMDVARVLKLRGG